MFQLQKISPDWSDRSCVVMASGPSLTPDVAHRVRMARWLDGWKVIAVNDAYRMLPHADILYGCDWAWWKHHNGAPDFYGQRWTCHSESPDVVDDKSLVADVYPLKFVRAMNGQGFSAGSDCIHYGQPQGSSGFQAVNLALLLGAQRVVLVGFDGHAKNGKHFFGDHPPHLNRGTDEGYREFAKAYPPDERIVNATPGSSIGVYRFVDLEEILRDGNVHRNRPIAHAASDRSCAP